MIRESLKVFLEKKLREIKAEIFEIRVKYKVSSVEEFEELYKRGEIEEKDTWQELQQLDHLEFKKAEMERVFEDSLMFEGTNRIKKLKDSRDRVCRYC